MMQKLIVLAAVCMIFSCSSTKNTTMQNTGSQSAATTQNNGWQSLFDGKSTAGWHTYGNQTVSSAWSAEDGTLHFDSKAKKTSGASGDLVTANEYGNFDLKLEWKISPNGNSGIIFYVQEDAAKYPNTYNTGMEMQVLDNAGHPDAKIIKHRAGDLYDLISVSKETVKKAGEWNAAEIVSNKGKLDFYLNGEHVLNTTIWDDAWQQMVAGSKFKDMPGFGTFKKGHIALQDHGDDVWYRNIMIKEL